MPMPNRNMVGGYRYAYQGQEKDPETGKEAFQLRLWDARIGRWLSPDPYGQYHSPYLGMGNNPINGVDPDGGCFVQVDGKSVPCENNLATGSTTMGEAGYEWIMTNSGWARSDGYFAGVGTSEGWSDFDVTVAHMTNNRASGAASAMFSVTPIDLLAEVALPEIANEIGGTNTILGTIFLAVVTKGKVKNTKSASNFFDDSVYSPKVLEQMKKGVGEFHSFPESVTAFAKEGTLSLIKSSDELGNVVYKEQLKIHGSYISSKENFYDGYFHFIKELDGKTINHRVFISE